MTWPEQDPYSPQPPYSSTPYQSVPQSGPPAGQYPQSGPPAGQYPQSGPPAGQYQGGPDPYQQAQYPQAGYPPYGYQTPPASAATNTMAILSLVLAFVFWPAAIVCGHVAKRQIRDTGEQGSGLATAGLVIGYIALGLTLLACGFWAVAVAMATSSSSY